MNNDREQFKAFIKSESILVEDEHYPSFFSLKNYLPKNVEAKSNMLGKRMEEFFLQNILASKRYTLIDSEVQIIDNGITIGELDFILKDHQKKENLHVELAYKFYLFNPLLDKDQLKCWVGPNKNDYLHLKLAKLQGKQLPLLYHPETQNKLNHHNVEVNQIKQKLCFVGKLYIPYRYGKTDTLRHINKNCIDGFWVSQKKFIDLKEFHTFDYFITEKFNWLIPVNENEKWIKYDQLLLFLNQFHQAKKSPQLWVKTPDKTFKLFVTWWS